MVLKEKAELTLTQEYNNNPGASADSIECNINKGGYEDLSYANERRV